MGRAIVRAAANEAERCERRWLARVSHEHRARQRRRRARWRQTHRRTLSRAICAQRSLSAMSPSTSRTPRHRCERRGLSCGAQAARHRHHRLLADALAAIERSRAGDCGPRRAEYESRRHAAHRARARRREGIARELRYRDLRSPPPQQARCAFGHRARARQRRGGRPRAGPPEGRRLARAAATARGKPGEIGFAVTRGGDIVGEHSVLFAGAGEQS